MGTQQIEFWQGQFGEEYTERNIYTPKQLNEIYKQQYGISREEMNNSFLQDLRLDNVLEVGCNVGNQLNVLQTMNIAELYGLELQWFAVEKAKQLTEKINIIQGSAFDILFKDESFDLVYTSGVLIHISPNDIHKIMDEMYRVSKKYIWGFEYYSEDYQEIAYRGNGDKMWKGNFAHMFLERFPQLKLIKSHNYPYTSNTNIDQMYLLEKQ